MDEKAWKNCFFNSILRGEGKTCIDFFLNAERNVNALKTDGQTMLSNATEHGYLEIVEYIVHKGADINMKNADGSSPLHIAAKYGYEDIVKFFYRSKCDLNVQTPDGDTPLLLAAKYKHKLVTEFLISSGADFESCNTDDKWTVLHHVCHHGWLDIVQTLVNRKCNLNVMSCGRTPLLLAAVYQKREVVALLIKSGADIECCNNDDKWTVLHYACHQGWLDIVKSLVNKKCNLKAKTIDGFTPWLLAKSWASRDIMALLVESGGDVEQCIPDFKDTVLHHVSSPQLLEVLRVLITNGIDFNIVKPTKKIRYLKIDCSEKSSEIMKYLLEAGAKWNIKIVGNVYSINISISLEVIGSFIENGAYFEDSILFKRYDLLKNPNIKNVELCTQSLINKFNNKDLPVFYEFYGYGECLPPIEKLKITPWQSVAREIEKIVESDVYTTGYFDLKNACPMVLKMLSVKALIDYNQLKLKNPSDMKNCNQSKIKKRRNRNGSKIKKRRLN